MTNATPTAPTVPFIPSPYPPQKVGEWDDMGKWKAPTAQPMPSIIGDIAQETYQGIAPFVKKLFDYNSFFPDDGPNFIELSPETKKLIMERPGKQINSLPLAPEMASDAKTEAALAERFGVCLNPNNPLEPIPVSPTGKLVESKTEAEKLRELQGMGVVHDINQLTAKEKLGAQLQQTALSALMADNAAERNAKYSQVPESVQLERAKSPAGQLYNETTNELAFGTHAMGFGYTGMNEEQHMRYENDAYKQAKFNMQMRKGAETALVRERERAADASKLLEFKAVADLKKLDHKNALEILKLQLKAAQINMLHSGSGSSSSGSPRSNSGPSLKPFNSVYGEQ